ncbi:MAG: hypothetical protein FJ027_17355 [Candidatus Rokubacteria bacterium]|nr:hypothetical protein [Candidatus Rokubacteria bacterium]
MLDEMTIDSDPVLRPDVLRRALEDAKGLFAPRWLDRQAAKRPRDPAHLDIQKVLRTKPQIAHALKFGLPDEGMHPVPEALLVAERSLADLDAGQPTVASPLFYRVLSLADVARCRASIPGSESRIARLTGPDWKSTLYELVTACSYAAVGVRTKVLEEGSSATPDIEIKTDPGSYIECKARLKYEQAAIAFADLWRREALVPVKTVLMELTQSSIVRVKVLSEQPSDVYRSEIPAAVTAAIVSEQAELEVPGRFSISIARFPSHQTFDPPVPLNEELWKKAVGFDEWSEWHYPSPDAEHTVLSSDRRFVRSVGKVTIVCARAEYLKDNRVPLLNALKDACRQFENYRPGAIHVLVPTDLFGLGALQQPKVIASVLVPELREVLQQYSRVWRIVIDLVSAPTGELADISAHRVTATSPTSPTPRGYIEPKRLLLL